MKILNPLLRLKALFQKHYHHSNPTNSMRVIKITYQRVKNNIILHHQYYQNSKNRLITLSIMNAYKVQIRVSSITKKQSKCTIRSKTKISMCKFADSNALYQKFKRQYRIYELFGLCSTKYLKQNCNVKISTNSNTEKKELCHCASTRNY